MDQASDDGAFWMDLRDWVDEFENLAICALPGLDINDPDGIISEEYSFEKYSFFKILV